MGWHVSVEGRAVEGRAVESRAAESRAAAGSGTEAPPAIKAVNLCKAYGKHVALDSVSFEAYAGEILGLLGRDGAGKTTTISCLVGLLTADSGQVEFFGEEPQALVRQGSVSVATQEIALYPGLSVARNLSFFASLAGFPPRELKSCLADVVDALALSPLLHRPVGQLSVGQQRIAHVACALAIRPRIVILDEPTSGLDVHTRKNLLDYLQVVISRGSAAVLSSHYLQEVEDTCDRVVLLDHGKCVAYGSVAELVVRFGGGHVEIVTTTGRTIEPGTNVPMILDKYRDTDIVSVRVMPPSLNALFTSLTASSEPQEQMPQEQRSEEPA